MKVLFVSNLYPDAAETGRGLYNARLVQHLGRLCAMRVLSPRPVLPFFARKFGASRAWRMPVLRQFMRLHGEFPALAAGGIRG